MTAQDILLNNAKLQLILGALAAIVAFFWLIHQFNERRERVQISRAKAERAAKLPRAKRAKRGGSTGKMTPLGAVLEVLDHNRTVEAYSLFAEERFAARLSDMTDLFNPDFRIEWLVEHDTRALFEVCDFIENLGLPDVAEQLRKYEPYKTWADTYYDRDEDPPDDAPEVDLYNAVIEWLDENEAWRRLNEQANAELERIYPWDEDDKA